VTTDGEEHQAPNPMCYKSRGLDGWTAEGSGALRKNRHPAGRMLNVCLAPLWSSFGQAAMNQLLERVMVLMGIYFCCGGSSFPEELPPQSLPKRYGVMKYGQVSLLAPLLPGCFC